MKVLGSTARCAFLLAAMVAVFAWPMVRIQRFLHDARGQVGAEQAIRFVPSGRFLSLVVLGHDNLIADVLWIRGVALFGEQYRRTGDQGWYEWLFQLIDIATELDPLDVMIYKYGGLMLRAGGARVEQSNMVFYKGMQHVPDEYFLPFGIAMNYLEFKHDVRHAAEYMRIAATTANAPFYLRNLAASLLDQNKQNRAARLFLEEQLRMLEPGSLRYKAVEVKILEVNHDAGAEKLTAAMREFMSLYHRIPEPLTEMKGKTWFGPWPDDPYGGAYVLDRSAGRIRSNVYLEARARIRKEVALGRDDSEKEKLAGP